MNNININFEKQNKKIVLHPCKTLIEPTSVRCVNLSDCLAATLLLSGENNPLKTAWTQVRHLRQHLSCIFCNAPQSRRQGGISPFLALLYNSLTQLANWFGLACNKNEMTCELRSARFRQPPKKKQQNIFSYHIFSLRNPEFQNLLDSRTWANMLT